MRLEIEDPRELGDAMAAFLIHHGLSEERVKAIKEKDLAELWVEWRMERGLPCSFEDEDWQIEANHYEALVHCLDLWLGGKYVGKLEIIGPPSREVADLLPRVA